MTPPTQATATKSPAPKAGSATFEQVASEALTRLRDSAHAAFAAAGGGDFNSLALSRRLGIDKSLSWRMVRFAQDPDVFAGSKHLPGDGSTVDDHCTH